MTLRCAALVVGCSLLAGVSVASGTEPTEADVAYGNEPRQRLDFYRAKSDAPTPLLFFVHGGGWLNGDKRSFNSTAPYLAAGISVAAVEYRYVSQAKELGVEPAVRLPMHDAARALQFVRTKATDWNLDPTRIAAFGSSAGGCTCLWLAYHDDLADPTSADPVARQSTRVSFVAVMRAQTSLDPQQMRDWIPNNRYGGQAFGFDGPSGFDDFLAARPRILPWIREYSPYELVTADDPPTALYYETPPQLGHDQANPAHSANFGLGLQQKLQELGVPCDLVYPGAATTAPEQIQQYLIDKLTASPPDASERGREK